MAVKMKREPKGSDIDKFICAEIPDDDPEAEALVIRYMLHSHYADRCYRKNPNK
jgi:hypothetical protein